MQNTRCIGPLVRDLASHSQLLELSPSCLCASTAAVATLGGRLKFADELDTLLNVRFTALDISIH